MDPLKRLETDSRLNNLLKAWETLRLSHREVPAQAVTVLLYVASHNPCHKQAIEEDLEISTSNSSRAADWLLDRKTLRKPGLGLISKEADPSNKRRTMYSLTQQGRHLANRLKQSLYG
jgi:DNA-binding MarR family transcriptional regulator